MIKMQMISKDAVLKIVQQKGPVIPNDIRKEMGGENLLISAILSELASSGKVKISYTKIGGTPAYYAPGAESRLQSLTKYLNLKDRESAEYLCLHKVLKDTDLTPLLRVSLRNIRDFAKPLEVNVKGQKEIYWKWYLLSTEEAEKLIFKNIRPEKKIEASLPNEPAKQEKQEPIKVEIKEELKKEEPQKQELKQEIKPEPKVEAKKPEPKTETKIEQKTKAEPEAKKAFGKQESQKPLSIPTEELEKEKDPFFKKILSYFKENSIQIIEYKILRKNSEIDMTIAVPSNIGSQEYYCKAKNKKKVNDGDLSTVYIQAQARKLPAIFLTNGELTKKAKEMLSKDFKGMTVKKI